MKNKLIGVLPIIVIPSLMLMGFMFLSLVTKSYSNSHHKSYIYFVEDLSAALPGDTLSTHTTYGDNTDTIFVGFKGDYPNGNKVVLLP